MFNRNHVLLFTKPIRTQSDHLVTYQKDRNSRITLKSHLCICYFYILTFSLQY